MYRLRRAAFILLAIGLVAIAGCQGLTRWRPSTDKFPVQGVDVSEASGAIEWPVVAGGGADFAYATATHGAGRRDQRFEVNWQGIAAAGIRRGAVHIWSFCQLAVDQANAFNTTVPHDAKALPAAIDIAYAEDCTARPAREVLVAELARAASMIESHTGKPVLLRIAKPVERDYDLMSALPRTLWATGNFFPPDYAARPWRMWRASDLRRIDGAEGPINWDVAAP